jgi:hypothetical protein
VLRSTSATLLAPIACHPPERQLHLLVTIISSQLGATVALHSHQQQPPLQSQKCRRRALNSELASLVLTTPPHLAPQPHSQSLLSPSVLLRVQDILPSS